MARAIIGVGDQQMRTPLDIRHYPLHSQLAVRTTHRETDTAELKVSGRLNAATAPAFACVVDAHLAGGRRFLRVNMLRLGDADAAGLAALLALHRRALAARGTLILIGVPDVVRAAINSAGLGQVLFLIAPTAAELRIRAAFPTTV